MATEKEIKEWYDQRHLSLGQGAWRPYEAYPVCLDYLAARPGKKLLDVGCGTGYLLKAADKRGLETWGVDISGAAVAIAKSNSPHSEIVVGKGEALEFPDGFFDYVTCLGSLEHFLDMGKGIREMVRVAKKDALFCVVVPNANFLLWKIGKKKGTKQREINENLLSLDQWKGLFVKAGLEVRKVYQDDWFVKGSSRFSPDSPVAILKRALRRLVWLFLPLNYTYQFIFILQKQ